MCRVIFVGSNPSSASRTILPFAGDTKSDKILASWISKLNLYKWSVCNVADMKTDNNKPLTMQEIKSCLPDLSNKIQNHMAIVALGKTAAKALTLLHVDFFEMPHPSPLNRKLNDGQFIETKLKELEMYIANAKKPQHSI